MEGECRYSPTLQEYLIHIKIRDAEIYQRLNPNEFAATVERMLAEKLAQQLFEKLNPTLIELLNQKGA